MGDDGTQDALRRYAASLTPEERAELARALLESTPKPIGAGVAREVPWIVVWGSRIASIGIVAYYWSLRGFTLDALPRLMLSVCLPLAAATFPNQLGRATGRLGMNVRISRASPPRYVLLLGWLILGLPIVASIVRWALAA